RRRHTRFSRDWSSDVCSSDLKFTNDYITEQFNYFYYPLTDTLEFNQLRNISRPGLVAGVFASYTEPLSEKFSARFVQRVSYSQKIGRASCRERVKITGW